MRIFDRNQAVFGIAEQAAVAQCNALPFALVAFEVVAVAVAAVRYHLVEVVIGGIGALAADRFSATVAGRIIGVGQVDVPQPSRVGRKALPTLLGFCCIGRVATRIPVNQYISQPSQNRTWSVTPSGSQFESSTVVWGIDCAGFAT